MHGGKRNICIEMLSWLYCQERHGAVCRIKVLIEIHNEKSRAILLEAERREALRPEHEEN